MFFEKSVYAPATTDEGARVLVMRTWPRGVSLGRIDVWLKDLGPARELPDRTGVQAPVLACLCRRVSRADPDRYRQV